MDDPGEGLKRQSRIVSFGDCELWFYGENLVVDSPTPLPDLPLREFAQPRIEFEGRFYRLVEKRRPPCKNLLYRYVLAPAASGGQVLSPIVVLDEDYFQRLAAERQRSRAEHWVFKLLAGFYPFLGFLWSPQKRVLNRIGFEAHAISSFSAYTGFLIGFCCAVFLVIFEFGSKSLSVTLLAGALFFTVDAVARYDRLLRAKDPIPPGFYEWLIRRKEHYE